MDPTKKRIRHVKRLAEAAVPLKHHWETPGPGRGKKLPPKQRVQSGVCFRQARVNLDFQWSKVILSKRTR